MGRSQSKLKNVKAAGSPKSKKGKARKAKKTTDEKGIQIIEEETPKKSVEEEPLKKTESQEKIEKPPNEPDESQNIIEEPPKKTEESPNKIEELPKKAEESQNKLDELPKNKEETKATTSEVSNENMITQPEKVKKRKVKSPIDDVVSEDAMSKMRKKKKRKLDSDEDSEGAVKDKNKAVPKPQIKIRKRKPTKQIEDVSDESREPTPPIITITPKCSQIQIEQRINDVIMSQKVIVFTKKEDSHSFSKVKKIFDCYCISYGLIELDECPSFEKQLYRMTCKNTLPLIFIDGKFLGGVCELKQLKRVGRMTDLMETCNFSSNDQGCTNIQF